MVISAMELRRVGLVSKPAIVVPNHMLEQFSREAQQLYPQANLLVAGADEVTAASRKGFVARAATGDWDAVIITHSAFEKLPVSDAARQRFLSEEVEGLRRVLNAAAAADRPSVKAIEKAIVRRETKLSELVSPDRKDDGVTFEATGIDYVCLDEAHLFKNLETDSRIQGLSSRGSDRASDLNLKLKVLRERNGARVATLATATPIANSVSEMHVMQRYLQPEALERAGVASFDAWAANFGRTVSQLELAPDGGSYRMNTRFARFSNVPDLVTMFRSVADVRTAEDLNLKVPDLVGGRPETVIVPATETLSGYVASLVDRAEAVRNRVVRPDEDNMLKVTGDGRRAALDLRLVGLDPEQPTKAEIVAGRVAEIHHAHAADRYYDPATGAPAERPGALQLVFCDLGTPKPGAWSVYSELRDQLVARGVPVRGIRFIHEAGNDAAKAELFAQCRDGRISVLIGSTEKMGVGTNVQARAVALHHMDCPWRPADLAQRDGRIVRQGNQNPAVRILRYATEASFDVYMWQTVQRKSEFIHQITAGRVADRSIDDIGDTTLSFAEVKALASGNPLIIEQATLTAELTRLTRQGEAHRSDQARLTRTATNAVVAAEQLSASIAQYRTAIDGRVDTHGDAFTMTVTDRVYDNRRDAGDAVKDALARRMGSYAPQPEPIGRLAGFELYATVQQGQQPCVTIEVAATPLRVQIDRAAILAGEPVALIRRIEQPIQNLERRLSEAVDEHARAVDQATKAQARIGLSFDGGDRLRELRGRLDAINAALTPPDPEPGVIDLDDQNDATPPVVPGAGGAVPVHRGRAPDEASVTAARRHPPPRIPDRACGPER